MELRDNKGYLTRGVLDLHQQHVHVQMINLEIKKSLYIHRNILKIVNPIMSENYHQSKDVDTLI